MILRLVAVCLLLGANAQEPNCVTYTPNRFEYEYNVIGKLIYLEQFKAETAGKITALEQQYKEVKLQLLEHVNYQCAAIHVINLRSLGYENVPQCDRYNAGVYTGQVGGEHFTHPGSGEYVCLPNDPQYDQYTEVADDLRSLMWGAEYESSSSPVFTSLNQNDVPCSVCLAIGKSTLMIPGRTSCYSGWTKEYQGYLMGEYYGHQGKGYVCMDKNAESLHSSFANLNGALFYMVEGRCGTLQCPPYVNGRELTCVVCSISK